jgi:hypothetical protein
MNGDFSSIRKKSTGSGPGGRKTRNDFVLNAVDSSLGKLYEAVDEKWVETTSSVDANLTIFFKEHQKSVTRRFFEKIEHNEQIDITSDDTLKLLNSSEGVTKENNNLLCVNIIGFHHKKGTQVQK